MKPNIKQLIFAVCILTSCSGESPLKNFKKIPAFHELESNFPNQFSVNIDSVTRVEFCPDNTCYAFESPSTVKSQSIVDFLYIYLFFSSRYYTVEDWRNTVDAQKMADQILNNAEYSMCKTEKHNEKSAQCVLNYLSKKKGIQVFAVRYDENDRVATKIHNITTLSTK